MSQTKVLTPMQRPRIGKVVVNIAIGKSGEQLQKAMAVLEHLVDQKPCQKMAKQTIRDWGIRQNEPIACAVTLRGVNAAEFVKRTLDVLGNKLPRSSVDVNGNFSFGITEHIEISGVRYDPALGIFGMDVCVAMEKPGYRVKRRHIRKARVGKRQRLTPEETVEYLKETFGTEIVE